MSEISIGRYLFERLNQVGVKTIFGLPGDFNLSLLDKLYEVPGLRWAGNANELNAAYAADGYARVNGMGCLVTTFGVGELSAINGIAGSYAECISVLHVVGVPSTMVQAKRLLLHHTLGDGDFTAFHRMYQRITKTTAILSDDATAASEIDRCIKTCIMTHGPVYLGVPANMATATIDASLLETPIDLSPELNDQDAENEVIDAVLHLIQNARNPIILSDACASRYDIKEEIKTLIDITQFPTYVTPMGKSSVNEQHPRYGGVYAGSISKPEVKKAVESADLILSIGSLLADMNTGNFSQSYSTKDIVEFHSTFTMIKNATFNGVQMKFVLQKLAEKVGDVVQNYVPVPIASKPSPNKPLDPLTPLAQQWLWKEVSTFLKEGDIVIAESGTPAFGINEVTLPTGTRCISQLLWGSIGYTVGACLGICLATQEIDPSRRVILFIGDGSLQLAVQELSTMIRWGLKPYLFVLNNDGYTIERLIHGPEAQYNDIQPWNHLQLLPDFGAKNYEAVRISTVGGWSQLTQDPEFNESSKIRLIELILPRLDSTDALVKQAKMITDINSKR
ncbi:alpha-keto acid decarboxylase family protein Ecym_3185 [Eremothecium cymbalariae DBVPG|uniref:Pyruvate decarboxylase n=1 Tax=Eremothecium cymbalariae (strain CBS 270.75 / DBVPG 7215 / KCTC 17166 / NRRL Y-17582) TaxID=931890 RepID=G8JRB5_ERECY|nr:Hypothetical protein Ecym_3185 [Eremothecium cymbalariae DBVPG\